MQPTRALLLASTVVATALSGQARAQDGTARLNALARQIQAMQAELRRLKHDMAVQDQHMRAGHDQEMRAVEAQAARAQATASARTLGHLPEIPEGYALAPSASGAADDYRMVRVEKPGPPLKQGQFDVGGVRVTLGGYIETVGIFRSRNEVADIASNFNTGIPLPNSPLYHENESRFTARQSRLSLMAQGKPDQNTLLTAYLEGDLQGAAPTANSNESDSYNPRLRIAYATYDRGDLGFYLMGGQNWSLLTMGKKGVPYLVNDVNAPAVIDAQYVPGFTWARQPQFRIAKSFDHNRYWVAASFENPQTVYYTGPNGAPPFAGIPNTSNSGGSGLNSPTLANSTGVGANVQYSTEVAPDVILKVAADPGWGHFEAYGVARFMHDRLSTTGDGSSHTVMGGGGGAAALIPIIPDLLDFQASFLTGRGIGRYGTSQLPDAVIGANGKPDPLPETQALIGLLGHPTPDVDVYVYGGTEQISRAYFSGSVKGKSEPFGYGNALYSNASCDIELGASSGCVGNTSGIVQGAAGAWWKFEKGPYGTMQVGPQYSYTHRTIFQGQGPTPKTDENILMLSFRYYPFQ